MCHSADKDQASCATQEEGIDRQSAIERRRMIGVSALTRRWGQREREYGEKNRGTGWICGIVMIEGFGLSCTVSKGYTKRT